MSNIEKLADREFVEMMKRAGILTAFIEATVSEYLIEKDEQYWREVYRLYAKTSTTE